MPKQMSPGPDELPWWRIMLVAQEADGLIGGKLVKAFSEQHVQSDRRIEIYFREEDRGGRTYILSPTAYMKGQSDQSLRALAFKPIRPPTPSELEAEGFSRG